MNGAPARADAGWATHNGIVGGPPAQCENPHLRIETWGTRHPATTKCGFIGQTQDTIPIDGESMRTHLFLLLLVLFPANIVAQETQEQHPDTTRETEASSTSRFRIIQSDLVVRLTFKLDRYTGAVSQLVKNSDGNSAWQLMDISPLPVVKIPDHARFQIFTSGLAVRFTFLLDNDTGKTWQLVSATTKATDGTESSVESWQLIP